MKLYTTTTATFLLFSLHHYHHHHHHQDYVLRSPNVERNKGLYEDFGDSYLGVKVSDKKTTEFLDLVSLV